ncbi:hypothetical protein BGZ76_004041 [Entomortierella beljakovae]|nr:hypothetical protein BGZ76_004041 [Entomortierella beljakovae]
MQWARRILTSLAQRLWKKEALRAVPYLSRNNITTAYLAPVTPTGNSIVHESRRDGTFDKSNLIDLLSLPCNLSIGSRIGATKILVDKPINTQGTTTTKTETNTTDNKKSNPKPVRRFSGKGGDNRRGSLTINTSTLVPSRTVGLEVASINDSQDTRYQLFCKDGIIFVNDSHPLVQSLEKTKSPPTSRDSLSIGVGGRRMSAQCSEDPTQLRKMIFSIHMKYRRMQPPFQLQRQSWDLKCYRLLNAFSLFINGLLNQNGSLNNNNTIDGAKKKRPTGTRNSVQAFTLNSVALHHSQWIAHNGRVQIRQQPGDNTDIFDNNGGINKDILTLDIFASTTSLETSEPIQILVRVETQPTVQDAFGNSDAIRKGETVLMEGLGLARQMAHTAGWSCLEDDDCQMVEWVRDQMNIQWSVDPHPPTLLPVSTTVEGLEMYTRPRTLSSAGMRVRTPNLSPYPSRATSFNGKRRGDTHGVGEKRDSTLKRLQDVSETLNAQEKQYGTEITDSSSKVTIFATENSTSPLPQRPGIRNSFVGFSSLSSSRNQALALAESTEDRLGMSLSLSPLIGSNNVKEQHTPPPPASQELLGSFSEGVGPLDLLGTDSNKNLSPKPSSLSRFSIKTYQKERSNNGLLGNDWALGSGRGGLNISSAGSGATSETSTTTTISDVMSTPPLIADLSQSGSVSPLSPSPKAGSDILQGLSSPKSYSVSRFSFGGVSRFSGTGGSAGGIGSGGIGGSGGSEELSGSTTSQDSNTIDNSNKRKGNISNFSNFSSTGRFGIGIGQTQHTVEKNINDNTSNNNSSNSEIAEEVHDFLGKSFGSSPGLSFKAKFERSPRIPEETFSQSLPTHIMPVETIVTAATTATTTATAAATTALGPTTKSVQFANINDESESGPSRIRFQRTHSEPVTMGESEDLSSPTNSTGSLTSSFSKSKAHTRRSWGQGIGGKDILGIQGLE